MKKFTFPMLLATALVAASCSNEEGFFQPNKPTKVERNPDNMIAFSSEDSKEMSRYGFTEGATKIVMLMSSQKGAESTYKNSRTVATGAVDATNNAASYSNVSFADANRRYWDDCFGRDAKLSVYALAIPNKNDDELLPTTTITGTEAWAATEGTKTITWNVGIDQSEKNMADLDLTYSNNIRKDAPDNKGIYLYDFSNSTYDLKTEAQYTDSETPGYDPEDRLAFQPQGGGTSAGKFNRGHLIFKHALCWVTINLIEGSKGGFNNLSTDDFAFTGAKNATLVDAYSNGTFDMAAGNWTATNSVSIAGLKDNSVAKAAKTTFKLEAMTLPQRVLYGQSSDFLTFEIDHNPYHVSCNEIAEAIRTKAADLSDGALKTRLTGFTTMTAGDHYTINITVDKTQVETITAEVVQWENVEADYTASNARIEFTLRDDASGTPITGESPSFAIYRALNNGAAEATIPANENAFAAYAWDQAYSKATTLEWNSTANNYKTDWFWESNKHFYHFRTVNPATTENLNSGDKTFTMTSGAQGAATDYQWGAPFYANGSKKLYYDVSNGYTYYSGETNDANRQLFKAIGPTKSDIHMLIQHMMSDVNIVLTTTGGSDAVNITGATVELLSFYNTATVNMGNGLVTPTGDIMANQTITADGSTYTWRVVPQQLKRDASNMVGIKITTSDNNQYYLVKDLSTLKVKTGGVTNNGNNRYEEGSTIDRWYPGYKYTYNILVKKTGIETVTAEVVQWEGVSADKEVTLESKKFRFWK